MQSLAKSGYSAAAVMAALHSSKRELHFRYDLLDSSNVFKCALTEVESVSIQLNTFAEIRRTARFTLQDLGTINFLSDRIKPYACVQVQTVAAVVQPTFARASTAYKLDGTSVAIDIPRYEDAAAGFGKGAMVEEGAVNLIPSSYGLMTVDTNSDGVVDGFTHSHSNEASVLSLDGGQKVTLAGVTNAAAYLNVTLTTSFAVSPNTSYALSVDAALTRSGAETVKLLMDWYTSGDVYVSGSAGAEIDPGVTYSRQQVVFASPPTAGKVYVRFKTFAKAIGATGVAHFRHAMFQPDYATSFHETSRAASTLTTPKAGVLSDTEGSVQCRIKPLRTYGTNHQFVFDGNGAANKSLVVYIASATGKPTLVYGTGAAEVTITSSGAAVASGTWYAIGWKWSAAGMALYVNGAPVGTDDTAPSLTLGATMYLGSKADGTLQLDGLLDDDRVSSIARTDAQILADYTAGKPLQIDRWTTYLVPFNDSLLAVQWPQLLTGYAEFPLGVFLLSTPPKRADVAGNITREVEAYDQTQVVVDDKTTTRYTIAASTNYITAVGTILTAAGITDQALTATASTLPAARDWPPGTKQLTIINDLLDALNYRALWFNESGQAVAQPYVSPSTRASEYTYADDDESVTFPEVVESLDLFGVPNKWLLSVSEPDRATLSSIVTNANATSPTSTVSRGRTIVEVRSGIDAPDQASLDAIAARIAYEASQVYQEVEFETAIQPFHSDLDVLTLQYSALNINAKFSETGWAFDCKAGTRHVHRIRRVVNII